MNSDIINNDIMNSDIINNDIMNSDIINNAIINSHIKNNKTGMKRIIKKINNKKKIFLMIFPILLSHYIPVLFCFHDVPKRSTGTET